MSEEGLEPPTLCIMSAEFARLSNDPRPDEFEWITRPHEPGEPARHVAELSDAIGSTHVRGNVWRYEPGAKGKRHRHPIQEETFVVLVRRAVDLSR